MSLRAKRLNLLLIWTLFFIVACTPQADVESTRAPTFTGSLQPYITPSPSAIPPSATPISTRTPLPTATPHTYTVKSGDTMGSIALEFGLDIGDLVNANPDISPYAMSIGQTLLIPDDDALNALPTVEPLALSFADPDCYATLSGGIWCFVLVQNDTVGVVEGISFEIQLYDGDGSLMTTETAFPLLDRLSVGETTSALLFFADAPTDSQAFAELHTAFEGAENDENYPAVSLQGVLTQISWDGKSAQVSGEVQVESDAVEEVWVVATAFGGDGAVVGVRRWESDAGGQRFDLTVASLGPEIASVSMSVEAHGLVTFQE